jgi:hypothetical protein
MGIYRKVYQPFGDDGGYQLDWPGIASTATQLGIDAAHLISGAQPLAPGAGVLAPSTAPPLLQAPPAGSPGVAASTSPWLLIGGAAAIYYFILK